MVSENRKIARNSAILYLRLIITTFIGLYVSRIVLLQLGASDFGLFSVVGGIVVMLNFLGSMMVAITFRYISVELGKDNGGNINKVFNTLLIIHILLAILLFIIVETFGVWYVKNYLKIAHDRISDSLFVLHITGLSVIMTIISSPYKGLLKANEKFNVNASVEIISSVLKLILVFMLGYYLGNKLKAYSIIMLIITFIPASLYIVHAKLYEKGVVKFNFNTNKEMYYDIIKYAGWSVLGIIAYMINRQGAALVINIFFGTLLNAAFGIGMQVYNFIMLFVSNITHAAVPQIMKSHSSGDSKRSMTLVYLISRFAFYVLLIPSIPILLSIDFILKLWLKEVPIYTNYFVKFLILNGLVNCIASGFDASIQATGKIRGTNLWSLCISCITILLSYFLFELGFPPYYIIIMTIFGSFVYLLVRINILSKITNFSIKQYLLQTIIPSVFVLLSVLPLFYMRTFFEDKIMDVMIITLISIIYIPIIIFLVGFKKKERDYLKAGLYNFLSRFKAQKNG